MIHCLHGAAGRAENWNLFKSSLGQKIVPHDLWQLFKNDSPTLPQAAEMINKQAIDGDILLGYSMGGRIALHCLAASPKTWRAAIIVSAHPGLTEGHAERLAHDDKWASLALRDWQQFLSAWNEQSILSKMPGGLSPALRKDQAAIAQSFRQWSLGRQENLRPQLKKVTCPTLWITGKDDQKFTTLAEEALTILQNSSHVIIPNCGHRVPWEKPKEFSQAVQSFLTEI